MLTYEELKEYIIVRKGKYFNIDDIIFFKTNTNLIKGVYNLNNDFIIFIDNSRFDENTNINFNLKVYNISTKKVQTLHTSNDINVCYAIMKHLDNLRELNIEEVEILFSSEIMIIGNLIHAHSSYYAKGINLN